MMKPLAGLCLRFIDYKTWKWINLRTYIHHTNIYNKFIDKICTVFGDVYKG